MGFLATLLAKAGLSERVARVLGPLMIVVVLFAALWWLRADAYADGVRDTDAKWEAASKKDERAVRDSVKEADKQEVKRLEERSADTALEKEKLREAKERGSSPFDVLF